MDYKEYTEAKRGTSWKQKLKQTIDRLVITAKDYASSSYEKLFFNRFREEDPLIHTAIPAIDDTKADFILKDNNLVAIKGTNEYVTNLSELSPTNRILTSLFSHKRFLMLLRYGFAYVERSDKNGIKTLQKHVMRYPQFFATLAIEKKLNEGAQHGIIWHTQGSGKTALAFHNVRYLRDYYQKQGKIAKFYFIVDRLDLLTQASEEFAARGLHVEKVNSKEDFIKNIRTIGAANNSGEDTITVVNIQKFSMESIARKSDYKSFSIVYHKSFSANNAGEKEVHLFEIKVFSKEPVSAGRKSPF